MIEGTSVALTATGTEPDDAALTFEWDLNLNGTYETSGQTVSFSAAALEAPASRTVGVRVTGPSGLTATDTATINVIWDFGGFLGKNEERPAPNTAKAGVEPEPAVQPRRGPGHGGPRGRLSALGRLHVRRHSAPRCRPSRWPATCAAGSGQYTYPWKTNKLWAYTCRTFVLKLADGTYHYVDVFFDK